MQSLAELLDRLTLTPQRNGKIRLITDYCLKQPDPDRGWAIAALTRDLDVKSVKPAMLRDLISERTDPVLFQLSYDYVGDLAETISLIWPSNDAVESGDPEPPRLSDVVEQLAKATRSEGPRLVETWLDQLNASGRYALLKLVTGALRVGVTARLAKQALADFGGKDVTEIEELWHGLEAPYLDLFSWLEGRTDKPESAALAPFRPVMLATPLDESEQEKIDPADYAAEWKWDGIRIQATGEASATEEVRRLYSRTGDDISTAFPDILAHLGFDGTIDGELLVARPGQSGMEIAPFSDLQQRLNRKSVSKKMLKDYPAFIRAYDLLIDRGEDLRGEPLSVRRERLERFIADHNSDRLDVSPIIAAKDWEELGNLRAEPPDPAIEGLMLKRWDAPYVPGRPKGPWYKWKRDPFLVDAVLMYAQRGHGKRSSFYSDFTFGVWSHPADHPDHIELVPVGKAYFGFTDAELKEIDRFVRNNTVERFGPVRSVRAEPDFGLVLEVAFEGLNRSTRHKSGLAMRFPRISRLRWDKPPHEADRIEALTALLPPKP